MGPATYCMCGRAIGRASCSLANARISLMGGEQAASVARDVHGATISKPTAANGREVEEENSAGRSGEQI